MIVAHWVAGTVLALRRREAARYRLDVFDREDVMKRQTDVRRAGETLTNLPAAAPLMRADR